MLNGMGITTGIDLAGLVAAGLYISSYLGRPSGSKVAQALGEKYAVEAKTCD
jgi:hydroxymethylglutaryl-CoA lyase